MEERINGKVRQTGGGAWKFLFPAGRARRGSDGTLGAVTALPARGSVVLGSVSRGPAACHVDGASRSGAGPVRGGVRGADAKRVGLPAGRSLPHPTAGTMGCIVAVDDIIRVQLRK